MSKVENGDFLSRRFPMKRREFFSDRYEIQITAILG